VSRRPFIANILVGALGCLFAVGVIRDLGGGRSLPPAPVPRESQSTLEVAAAEAPPTPITAFHVIATKNPFNPGRLEATATSAASAMAPGVKPVLHGVLLDGDQSRAYLEEPPARQVYGYAIGDRIAGGRLESIAFDRVVIVRPDGPLEVLLQDPAKPKPGAPRRQAPRAGAVAVRVGSACLSRPPPRPYADECEPSAGRRASQPARRPAAIYSVVVSGKPTSRSSAERCVRSAASWGAAAMSSFSAAIASYQMPAPA
jgi:hypothetical protein